MTILPKKKSSGTAKGPDHLHRDSQGAQNQDHQLAFPPNQNSAGNNVWGSGLPSGSPTGWSPPPPSGPTVASSQRWPPSSSGASSPDFVVSSVGSKRPGPACSYADDTSSGVTTSKRRHVDRSSVECRNVEAGVVGVSNAAEAVVGPAVRGSVLASAALSPTGSLSPNRTASPPQPGPSHGNVGVGGAGGGEGGYNSEDEYSQLGRNITEDEWLEKDRKFERAMKKKGFLITRMVEDGSCLFRAVADQIYGDQEMHPCVRQNCMDYIAQNSDYYSQYVTEDISDYIERKRYLGVHGNHLEIQALSEMYNRPIHIYCYSTEPINIFQGVMNSNGNDSLLNAPIRLCYHRGVHYNSIVDPHKPTIGVGLGLPGMIPGAADRNLLSQAYRANEDVLVEQAMLEDKIKATDWEATNEAIEEQVARESYLQWLRDNERRNKFERSSTVTSGDLRAETLRSRSPKANSPKPGCSSMNSSNSPKAGCSFFKDRDSPKPTEGASSHKGNSSGYDYGLGRDFQLLETASFLNGLPPDMFGLEDWAETDVLTQVIAVSQQEYLDSLKKQQQQKTEQQQLSASTATSATATSSAASASSTSSCSDPSSDTTSTGTQHA